MSGITCKTLIPPSCSSTLPSNITNQAKLYVPIQSTELYKTTFPWRWFVHIVGVNFDSPDVNADGEINIADINAVINAITNDEITDDEMYDVNGDGEINIADINAIINAILNE